MGVGKCMIPRAIFRQMSQIRGEVKVRPGPMGQDFLLQNKPDI